eukprot:m.495338 g.495338  ORF g.495338 m.495338 type:complete len:117 (-) comp57299_c0_seq1:186-536(-)
MYLSRCPGQDSFSESTATHETGPSFSILLAFPFSYSVEVGTIGGGTTLPAQKAALSIIGCSGSHPVTPGLNADTLARVVAGTVLAGEISLLAALASGDLLKSHMLLNRKKDSDSRH